MKISYWKKMIFGCLVFSLIPIFSATAAAKTTIKSAVKKTTPIAYKQPVRDPNVEDFIPEQNMFASAVVIDAATNKELYAFKPTKKWPAASLTKLMTALVFVEKRPSWNTVVKLSKADEVGGGRLRLAVGSRFTVRDAFYSSLVGSANNATMALARSTGYSKKGFLNLMNKKAKAIGMTSSSYADPSGMEPTNIITARDMVKLMRASFAYSEIQKAASTGTYKFTAKNPTVQKTILTTDKLKGQTDLRILGAKTGFLYESEYNFVMKVRPENQTGKDLYVVVLGAPTKQGSFQAAESLAKWALRAYKWN
ncbi:D-alanyl-D-alanine carboxypeptidase [Candidatus Uhrbacteria bacterium]|nr:D-alanyl-D-alanine carboxypeptidase [Candidatus Uhrbacteria bacterium]